MASPISCGCPFSSGVCHCLLRFFLSSPRCLGQKSRPVLLSSFLSTPQALLPVSQSLLVPEQLPSSLAGCCPMLCSCRLSDNLSRAPAAHVPQAAQLHQLPVCLSLTQKPYPSLIARSPLQILLQRSRLQPLRLMDFDHNVHCPH